MRYRIRGSDGRTVEVQAVDWMMAMAQAIQQLGIEVSGWICETRPGGEVNVTDPASGRSWIVEQTASESVAPAPPRQAGPPPLPGWAKQGTAVPASPAPASPAPATPAPAAPARKPIPPARPDTWQPRSAMASLPPPEPVSADDGPPGDLAERLFDLSMELSSAESANDACRMALDIAMQLVPCEAGSVLRGSINDDALTFVATAGPAAAKLLGQKVRFGEGIAGVTFDLGITVLVKDVRQDPRHLDTFDQETGFRTRSIVAVPVRTETEFFGALELLNPPRGFLPWHIEVGETVARSLASTLEGAG